VLAGKYSAEEAIRPRLADFESFLQRVAENPANQIPETVGA
jgi:hypothetical protein